MPHKDLKFVFQLVFFFIFSSISGGAFSLLGFFQTIISLIASLAYNAIYIYTNNHNMPAAVFIVASFTVIIPIAVSL